MGEIDFEDLDYSRMMCNVMSLPASHSPEDVYEVFKKYEEFIEPTPEIDRKRMFRYIVLVYDKHSPLHTVIHEIKRLKGKAAELSGFKKDEKGNFSAPVEDMMLCSNSRINAMIIRYVTLHKSAKYNEYVVLREAHHKLAIKVILDPTPKDLQNFQMVGERADAIQQELLNQDNNDNLQEALSEYYFEDRLALRPEDIARKIKEKKEKQEADGAQG